MVTFSVTIPSSVAGSDVIVLGVDVDSSRIGSSTTSGAELGVDGLVFATASASDPVEQPAAKTSMTTNNDAFRITEPSPGS
ncbi:MAG: hypothetical protein GY722_08140 [bacterium]|nr:hypothetical protein [bacterium]